jgi:hypothetical protein
MDSAAVRGVLGSPDSVARVENPFNPGGEIATWRYPDLEVSFAGSEQALGVALTGSRLATARGARVGDTAERVRALYGEPGVYEDTWDYTDARDASDRHVVRFTFRRGRVSKVFLGWLLD